MYGGGGGGGPIHTLVYKILSRKHGQHLLAKADKTKRDAAQQNVKCTKLNERNFFLDNLNAKIL